MCRSGVYGIDPRLPASLVASLIAATSATRSGEEARASFPGVASGLVERVERVGERVDAGAPRPYSWGVWMRAAISHVRPRDLVERARGVRSRRGAISYFAIVCIDNKQRLVSRLRAWGSYFSPFNIRSNRFPLSGRR